MKTALNDFIFQTKIFPREHNLGGLLSPTYTLKFSCTILFVFYSATLPSRELKGLKLQMTPLKLKKYRKHFFLFHILIRRVDVDMLKHVK